MTYQNKPSTIHRIIQSFFLLGIIFVLGITVIVIQKQQETRQHASELPELLISSNKKNAAKGEELIFALSADAKSYLIRAVEINMTYPMNKLSLKEVKTDNSAFSIPDEYIVGNGLIKISREASIPLSGEKPIALLTFPLKTYLL